jgi:tetratricopeptide (TPR) repeat protein
MVSASGPPRDLGSYIKIRFSTAWIQLSALLLLLGAGASPACAAKKNEPPSPVADPNRIINDSYAFLKEREPDMSETEFALYEKVVPMITAQPDFALKLLEGMVAEADCSPAFEFVLGNVYFEQKRYPDSEIRFKRAIEKFGSFIRAWDNLGVLYFTTERYAEAVPCFTKAITLGGGEPRMFGLLGFCQFKAGNPLAAEAAYMQAYLLDSSNGDWIEGLLSSYLESRQFARAETLLRQLIRLRPRESRFWLLLGNVILSQERKLDAIAQLETAVSLEVLEPDGMMMLGDLYAEQKMHAEAVQTYQRLAAKSPALGVERMLRFANALTGEQKLAEAARVLEAVSPLASDTDRAAILQSRADLHQAREEWATAKPLLEQVIELDPLNGRALLDLGTIEEALGQDSRALLHFEAATQVEEEAYSANLKLANLHVKLQHYTQALECIDKALVLQKSSPLSEFRARVQAMVPKEN